jgi:hypothetical protein
LRLVAGSVGGLPAARLFPVASSTGTTARSGSGSAALAALWSRSDRGRTDGTRAAVAATWCLAWLGLTLTPR